jgi:CobQ-like glutamine amidotransferase family enzyme
MGEEQKDALDNLYNFAGFVGCGIGNLIHRRRADSHPVGHCVGSNGNPPDSGAQGSWLAPIVAGYVHPVLQGGRNLGARNQF